MDCFSVYVGRWSVVNQPKYFVNCSLNMFFCLHFYFSDLWSNLRDTVKAKSERSLRV